MAELDRVGERERMELEESLRRLARSLHGGLTHRRRVAARGGRLRTHDAPQHALRRRPFSPVTVRRAEDRPRLVVLTDVSLSVRATARFTLHLVHGLQNLFGQVRAFAFVADLSGDHRPVRRPPGRAGARASLRRGPARRRRELRLRAAFGEFLEEFTSAVTRRTTVLVLGDARGNGNDPNMDAFKEITRRARETIWLTRSRATRGGWAVRSSAYSEYCSRVRVVRDLTGLESAATDLATELVGR